MPIPPETQRIVNTTIHKYIRQEEVAIIRNRKLLALMDARGRISYNNSGDLLDWKVRFARGAVQGFAESDVLTFTQVDRHKTAQLPYRGYAATDSMTKKQSLMNRGTEAIVKIYGQVTEWMMEDIEEAFGDELFVDGNASGNSKRLHGFDSFTGNTGSPLSNSPVADPNDTYAELTTGLADYGGAWDLSGGNTTWPTGRGDGEYDFWSPLIVDVGNSSFQASTDNWANNAEEALRYGIIMNRRNKSMRGMLDLVTLDREWYRLFLEQQSGKERINFQRTDTKKATLLNLGYSDVVNFEGVEVTEEFGVPATTGYGWAMDHVELCSMQETLFVPDGPDWSIETRTYRYSVDFLGNLKFKQPRYFVKWLDL